jgi:acyl carrier protein
VSEQADLKRRIKGVIVDRMNLKMNPEDVKDDEGLFGGTGLGLDSIDALDLVVGIYEEFAVELKDDDMHIFASVDSIAAFLEAKLTPAVA